MRIARWRWLPGILAAALVVGTVLAAGCGGGGDKIDFSGSNDNGSNSATKDSGNNGSDSGNQDSGGSSKDADNYASQFCGALSKYSGDIQELSNADTNMEDPAAMKDFIDQMVPVFEGISKDLDKINPPSDVAEWHNGVVSGMSDVADLFGKMATALDKPFDQAMAEITDLSSQMNNLDNPFGSMTDLPTEYQQAFENNADCQELQNLNFFQ